MRMADQYMLRLAWICGFVSSRDYVSRVREGSFGPDAVQAAEAALARMERALLHERVAVVLFLVGIVILTYTLLNAPALPAWLSG